MSEQSFVKPSADVLKSLLTPVQYEVTQMQVPNAPSLANTGTCSTMGGTTASSAEHTYLLLTPNLMPTAGGRAFIKQSMTVERASSKIGRME